MKRAIITGITGQDGSYLTSFCWPKAMRCMAWCDHEARTARRALTISSTTQRFLARDSGYMMAT